MPGTLAADPPPIYDLRGKGAASLRAGQPGGGGTPVGRAAANPGPPWVDELVAGVEPEVGRVAEHHVEPERLDLAGLDASDHALGGERDEGGGADRPVGGLEEARARSAFAGRDLEGGHGGSL
jgi:hypothetical protein